jgi:flagellin-like hook-associated protein FlgL
VDFADAQTVADLLDRINAAGVYVEAELNDAATGIDLVSLLNGAEFTVDENGGATAAELGLLLAPAELPLERLNRGLGVTSQYGYDFTVTLHDGTVLSCDVSSCATLADVVAVMTDAAGNGGKLQVEYGAAGTSLVLTDTTSGTGELAVEAVKGSLAARHLGIEGATDSPTLAGEDLDPAGVRVDGLFNALILLRDGLAGDDQDLLLRVQGALDRAHDLVLDARAEAGGRINRLELAEDRFADEKIRFQEAIATDRDIDLAEYVLKFKEEQSRLEAALSAIGLIANVSLLDFLR